MSQRQKQLKEQYNAPGYPLMLVSEIHFLLEALGIAVTMEELSKPHAQIVQMIYSALLDSLMGAPLEMIEGPKGALMGMMEYKELYSDALQFTMFFRHCRDLTELCGVTNFGMADLTRPDPGRLRSQLSGIMNFAKFREERLPMQQALQTKIQQQKEEAQRLRRDLDRIEIAIEEIKAKHALDKPLTEEAKVRNENIRAELLGLRSEQVKLSHEVDELKSQRQALMETAASKTHELTTLQSSLASAKSRLVQSPDRIKKHISEMSYTVSQERSSLQAHQRKARELAHRLEVIGGMEVDVKGLIDLEKGIEIQRGRVEEARRNVVSLKGKVEGMDIEIKSLDAKLSQLDRQLGHAQEKVTRQQEAQTEMQGRATAKYASLREEYVHQSKERRTWQKERDRLVAEQKAIEEEMANFVAIHEGEINALLQEYWTMRKQAEDYMNTVTVKLGLKLEGTQV